MYNHQHRRRLLRTLVFYSHKLTFVRNEPNRRIPCPKPSSAVCSEVKLLKYIQPENHLFPLVDCTHAGASFPQVRIAKKPNWPTNRLERPSLQHELLPFSGCAGLRLFASFLKLDQGFRIKRSPALKTHSILQTIGWSEVSSVKVMNASCFCQLLRSRTRRSGWRPFTMWSSCSS